MCPIPTRPENKKGDKAFETGGTVVPAISWPNLRFESRQEALTRQ